LALLRIHSGSGDTALFNNQILPVYTLMSKSKETTSLLQL